MMDSLLVTTPLEASLMAPTIFAPTEPAAALRFSWCRCGIGGTMSGCQSPVCMSSCTMSMAKGAEADDESLAEMHWLVKLFAPSDNDMERQAALYEMRHYSTMSFRETGGLM